MTDARLGERAIQTIKLAMHANTQGGERDAALAGLQRMLGDRPIETVIAPRTAVAVYRPSPIAATYDAEQLAHAKAIHDLTAQVAVMDADKQRLEMEVRRLQRQLEHSHGRLAVKAADGFYTFDAFEAAVEAAYGRKRGWRAAYEAASGVEAATIRQWCRDNSVPKSYYDGLKTLHWPAAKDAKKQRWTAERRAACRQLLDEDYELTCSRPELAGKLATIFGFEVSKNMLTGLLRATRVDRK